MPLSALELINVRNLSDQLLSLSPGLNYFYGHNGAGKSSILESIYILGTGKSFRTSQLSPVVKHTSDMCQIGGRILEDDQGLSSTIKCIKHAHERPKFLIDDEPAGSVATLAHLLPLQLLNLDAYQLLADPPEERRRWMDWMMFHVEPSFYLVWREYHRLLKQRNAALRAFGGRSDLPQWTTLLSHAGEKLHAARVSVMSRCIDMFGRELESLPGVSILSLSYHAGWDDLISLEEQFFASHERDVALGYTHAGPHRADLKIVLDGRPAAQILSTGQQKTFVTGLQLAQVSFVIAETGRRPILLIDDLPSELDSGSRAILGERLKTLDAQIFLTGVDAHAYQELGLGTAKMFHVEHGLVTELDSL